MAALSDILAKLADSLRGNGTQFAGRALEVMSAVMTFLQSIAIRIDDDVAAASYLTTLLTYEDSMRASAALGISSDLIPKLSPSVIGLNYQLAQVLSQGTPQQAQVAAAALFSRYTIAGAAGDDAEMEEIRKWCDIATLEGSRNQELVSKLIAEMCKVSIFQPLVSTGRQFLFSISIDLFGSTDAKSRIMKVAQGNSARINKLNESIYRNFCRIERAFYKHTIDSYAPAPPIDPARFFTVKESLRSMIS